LLIECFNSLITWNVADRTTDLASTSDFAERLLYNLVGELRIRRLGGDVLELIRSEGVHGESDTRRLVEEAFGAIAAPIASDLARMRPPGSPEATVADELLAYSLLGAMDATHMRASWGSTYTRLDLIRAHLWLYLAIEAAMSGEVDLEARMARYEELTRAVAERGTDLPAGLAGEA